MSVIINYIRHNIITTFLLGVYYKIDNDILAILKKTYVDQLFVQHLQNTTFIRQQLLVMHTTIRGGIPNF